MKLLRSTVYLLILFMITSCTQEVINADPAANSASQIDTQTTQIASTGTDTDILVTGTPTTVAPPTPYDIVEAQETVLRNIYSTVTPSVVHILTINVETSSSTWMVPSQGEGSGFVWDFDGHIVTNYHVVEGAEEVVVTFWDGKQASAEVLGQDPFSDLAVLRVNAENVSLFPVELGDDSTVQVGDLALAIGHPFRQRHTMTSGIISAIGRTRPSGTTQFSIPDVIQTDAPINPGNSGGPLLNRLGQVIGINTQIISSGNGANSGIGFAVPVNIAKRVIPTLIQEQEYQYGWLGITGINLTPRHAGQINLQETTQGVYVHSIVENSPADTAGLKPSGDPSTYANKQFPEGGSVIVSINGEPVTGMDQLISYLVQLTRPGDTITLGILNVDGGKRTLEVVLGVRPDTLP